MRAEPSRYFYGSREDVVALVPPGLKRVLDIGCGAGRLGAALKTHGVEEVVGVEMEPNIAREAAAVLDKVYIGDVEKMLLEEPFEYFDCIIYADVLEHLVDPWRMVEDQRKYLKPGGFVVSSIPNVACYLVLWELLRGNWRYTEPGEGSGLLERGHLRFFTWRSICELFTQNGYQIIQAKSNIALPAKLRFIGRLPLKPLRDWFTSQYLVVAQKPVPRP